MKSEISFSDQTVCTKGMVIKMDYRDYQPKKTSRVREDIEWTINYSYNTLDTKTRA